MIVEHRGVIGCDFERLFVRCRSIGEAIGEVMLDAEAIEAVGHRARARQAIWTAWRARTRSRCDGTRSN